MSFSLITIDQQYSYFSLKRTSETSLIGFKCTTDNVNLSSAFAVKGYKHEGIKQVTHASETSSIGFY